MKRIALFLDGTSRATLIPYAPILIGHLLKAGSVPTYYLINAAESKIGGGDDDGGIIDDNDNIIPEELWSSITWATAGMIAIYMIGRAAGTALGAHSAWVQYIFSSDRRQNHKSRAYSRTIGAILALHLFSFGAGIHQLPTLYVLRFCMGLLVGLLLRVASGRIQDNEQSLEMLVENGVAKVWLAGFAISMLTSGLLYDPLSHSPLFVLLTGGDGNTSRPWEWIVATLFFIVMIFVTENVCQFCCGKLMTTSDDYDEEDADELLSGNDEFDLAIPSKGATSLKKRNVSSSRDSSSSSCSGKPSSTTNSVNSAHWNSYSDNNRPRLGSNGGHGSGRLLSVETSGHHQNRLRLDSNYSTKSDVFFDCESQCDGVSVSWGLDEELGTGTDTGLTDVQMEGGGREYKDHSLSIAKYENGKCVYDDGSPSPVQAGLCTSTTPKSFYAIHKSKADAKWEESKKWRIERRLWKIHSLPHSLYGKIKDAYPHQIHGHTKSGYPIMYERPGGMSLKQRFSDGSITVDDMKYHYTYLMEYFSNVLCQLPECRERLDNHRPIDQQVSTWGFFVVMDVTGLSLTVLSGDVLRYLQGAGAINADHYPHTTAHALVVNSPFWLSSAFSTIKSILPDNTTVDLLSSSNQLEGLRKFIDDDQIPQEFGGSSPYPLGEHPYEKQLADLVESCKDVVDDGEPDDYIMDHPMQQGVQANSNPAPSYAPTSVVSIESLHEVQENTYNNDPNIFDVENGGGEMAHLITPQLGRSTSEISEHEYFDQADHGGLSLRYGYKWENTKYHSEEYVFFMISAIHCIWCALQGSLETLLSIWLLSPQTLGGLGYEPRRSGFALFTAAVVVLWLQRSRIAKCFVHIPTNSPLRGYRIGVGAEVFLLLLLPFVPFISNFDNMLVLTTNILLGVSISIASILGRLSLARLHSIASSAYVGKISLSCDGRTKLGQTLNMIANFVQKGGFTYILGVSGEVTGSVIVAPIIVWSAKVEHHFPIDTSLSFYTGAGLCAILYMLSFSFKVTGEIPNREFDNIQQGSYHSAASSTRCSIFRDICAVSVSDVASLFEESNWSSTSSSSTLGRHSGTRTVVNRKHATTSMKRV